VLYLDSDVIVMSPLALDLLHGRAPLMVARRCSIKRAEQFNYSHPLVAIKSPAELFNSGVIGVLARLSLSPVVNWPFIAGIAIQPLLRRDRLPPARLVQPPRGAAAIAPSFSL